MKHVLVKPKRRQEKNDDKTGDCGKEQCRAYGHSYNKAETTLDEALDMLDAGPAQKELIRKKLKGDYKKDRKVLADVLKLDERNMSYDTELFFIGKIKNYQLIASYFDAERLDDIKAELRKCILVDETVKIAAKSVKEPNEI